MWQIWQAGDLHGPKSAKVWLVQAQKCTQSMTSFLTPRQPWPAARLYNHTCAVSSCRRSHSLSKFRNSNVSEKWKCCDHLSHSHNYYHEDGVATNVLWAFSESSAEKQFWNRLVVVDCNLLCAAAAFSVVREVLASGNSSEKQVGTKSKHEPNKLAKL